MKPALWMGTVALTLATACGGDPSTGSASAGESETGGGETSSGDTRTSVDPTGTGGASGSTTEGPTSSVGGSASEATTVEPGATTVDDTTAAPQTGGTSTSTGPGEPGTSTGDTTSAVVDTTSTTGDTTGLPEGTSTTTGDGTTGDEGTSTTGAVDECGSKLKVTVRDFSIQHPDFEKYGGDKAYKGLVKSELGPDQKPVYAHPGPTPQTSGPDAFKQWYNDVPGVNHKFSIELELTEIMPGIYQYNNSNFFPIDGQGFGNEGFGHNFAFTTEIHTEFIYNGGEKFTFTGDDDLWMFINGKLAIDLGGLHPPDTQTVDLDAAAAALGISPGNVYDMDIFHAERHSTGSNFRIDTTIGCFVPQ